MVKALSIKLQVDATTKQIGNDIVKHLVGEVREYFDDSISKIKDAIVQIITDAITNSPEYISLVNGQLKAEFGLPDSENRVNALLDFWQNTYIEFSNVVATGGKLKGKFTLNMIKSDFSDAINLPEAIFTTEKGTDLNWLQWLLLFGDTTIIKDYEVELGANPRSRTGLAVMKKTLRGKWRVPSEFSGTINNNWITRSIDSVSAEIENLIQSSLL